MRTNPHTRETMGKDWQIIFEHIRKTKRYGKYYPNGDFRTTAYNTEDDNHHILQAAPRRQHGCRIYMLGGKRREVYEELFGRSDIKVNEIFSTCSRRYGGLWVYDTNILNHTPTKPRNGNPYYQVNIDECIKVCDIWDVIDFVEDNDVDVYHVARNQYEHMMKPDEKTGLSIYDKVQTWEDLPNYCLWKWQMINGEVMPDRIEKFEEYKTRTRNLSDYIPPQWNNKNDEI